MPQVEITCYHCNDAITIPEEQFERFMEEYNYCLINTCQNETCRECKNICDKCQGIYCIEHFNGATRMCVECDPKEEND